MAQNYKIFSGEKEIIITSDDLTSTASNSINFNLGSADEIEEVVLLIRKKTKYNQIIIHTPDAKASLNAFKKRFRYLEAAGGVVRNQKGKFLFIYKNEKWDLPKGLINKHEKKKEAALREITEECGIKKLTILSKLLQTYHIGSTKGRRFLKKTYWYEVYCEDDHNIFPGSHEGITKVKWIGSKKLNKKLLGTYANLRYLLESYLDIDKK